MITTPQLLTRAVPAEAELALRTAGVTPLLARLYAARGIASHSALDLGLATLPSADLLRGAQAAAERLADAIARQQRLLIVADYDADGATACAVAVRGLRKFGARVDFIVPNRFEFGYGLTPEIVALAAGSQPDVLITVDNGIASLDGVAAAKLLGIDVIVTDHHLPGPALPETPWIVNPNQPGCEFPSKAMAGVGVMFYTLLALRAELRRRGCFATAPEPNLAELLPLVAVGTVADVVPLDRVNRVLVHQGLQRIRNGVMPAGVRALFATAGRDPRRAAATDLGFVVGPRINAAGRLADMSLGISCLLCDDADQAQRMAGELDSINRERRAIEAGMQEEAMAALSRTVIAEDNASICLRDPTWHPGVVGIVAGRLKDRFHRPTLVFAPGDDGEWKGSGRSIQGFHLRDALDLVAKRVPGAILRFGGHAMAAGLTVAESHFDRVVAAFEEVAASWISPEQRARKIVTDGSLPPDWATLDMADEIAAGVWGQEFPEPLFHDRFEVAEQRLLGGKHLKLKLRRDRTQFEAIAFGQTETLGGSIECAYRLSRNEYQGNVTLQLVCEHLRCAST